MTRLQRPSRFRPADRAAVPANPNEPATTALLHLPSSPDPLPLAKEPTPAGGGTLPVLRWPAPSRSASSVPVFAASRPGGASADSHRSGSITGSRKLRKNVVPGSAAVAGTGSSKPGQPPLRILEPAAWLLPDCHGRTDYAIGALARAENVPELWIETGNVYVYVRPPSAGRGPSFKLPSHIISPSAVLSALLLKPDSRRVDGSGLLDPFLAQQVPVGLAPPGVLVPPDHRLGADYIDLHLYIPAPPCSLGADGAMTTTMDLDAAALDRVVAVRNLFAFLLGLPLVATGRHQTAALILTSIADLLSEFCYFRPDSAGAPCELVDRAFGPYIAQLGLADFRSGPGPDRIVDALVLAERMRSVQLYNNAFSHAVGCYDHLVAPARRASPSPGLTLLSAATRQRLERAHASLSNRLLAVHLRLYRFDFPALFAGVAGSTSLHPTVRPKAWRAGFVRLRAFVLAHYKATLGHWPPRAGSSSSSNVLGTQPHTASAGRGGLTRLALRMLYADMCALYDLLVDRSARSPRASDRPPAQQPVDLATASAAEVLRLLLAESDASSPPVVPPLPFDLPLLPTMATVLDTYARLPAKQQLRHEKQIQDHDRHRVLHTAYNPDVAALPLPFLDAFIQWECRQARGRLAADWADARRGYWIFLYVVIQSLPLVVVDAPGLLHTDAVPYFLSEAPCASLPWAHDGLDPVRKAWGEVLGRAAVVQLSADADRFSIEAIYHRSHCWLAARAWERAAQKAAAIAVAGPTFPQLPPSTPSSSASSSSWSLCQQSTGLDQPTAPAQHDFRNEDPCRRRRSAACSPAGSSTPSSSRSPPPSRQSHHPTRYHDARSGIVLSLEPLPHPTPHPHQRSVSTGPHGTAPDTPAALRVSASASSLPLGRADAAVLRPVPAAAAGTEVVASGGAQSTALLTFDDILAVAPAAKIGRKKSRFLLMI